ncbi:hypothetical protein TELCIR_04761 [Teladorsagia circumcincta]|uniref:Alkaline ceramidase n=1 Tax=Teladorsagia circumcincta TaxID=45464 RepID=A0A2G9USM4_TELCI|nr:hypothetical protein TELCIR_04761 [Teladorsagia circumcincta]
MIESNEDFSQCVFTDESTIQRYGILVQDNAPAHKSAYTTARLQSWKARLLDWPAESPDLNPIELVWGNMKAFIRKRNIRTVEELRKAVVVYWKTLTPERKRAETTLRKQLYSGKRLTIFDVLQIREQTFPSSLIVSGTNTMAIIDCNPWDTILAKNQLTMLALNTIQMTNWFEYESGHAWCESAYKYQTLPMVAEFANTMTNLPIIVLPMLNAMMLRRYIRETLIIAYVLMIKFRVLIKKTCTPSLGQDK